VSVLSGTDIDTRLSDAALPPQKRLVVTPLLSADQVDKHQASIDLRLGSVFVWFRRGQLAKLDWSNHPSGIPTDRTYVPLGKSFIIHPNQFVLAQTLEYVRLPDDIMGYVVTRSSWGRTGLIVATAVGIHPNFVGVITLELRNLGEVPLELWPGSTVLQLFLHSVTSAVPYADRAYSMSTETLPPRMVFDDRILKCALGNSPLTR
jgi:dCTP deaminase